jgi:Bax protein
MKRLLCYPLLMATALLSGCDWTGDQPATSKADQRPSLAAPQQAPVLPDFSQFSDVKAKKLAFFSYLEPMIEQENRHIRQLRDHLIQLQQQPQLDADDQQWLDRVSRRYRVSQGQPREQLNTLLLKLGEIPPALVKAQAANESAWGTSRFARQANNLFGQWCFTPGCGIEPMQRGPEQTHEVQAFANVAASLRSYFTNLNGNQSYADLRQIRRCLDQQQLPLSARALAAGLVHYSARGGHYVDELRSMIRHNRLEPWEPNWWGEQQPQHPCYPLVQAEAEYPDPIAKPPADQPDGSVLALNDSEQEHTNLPLTQDE